MPAMATNNSGRRTFFRRTTPSFQGNNNNNNTLRQEERRDAVPSDTSDRLQKRRSASNGYKSLVVSRHRQADTRQLPPPPTSPTLPKSPSSFRGSSSSSSSQPIVTPYEFQRQQRKRSTSLTRPAAAAAVQQQQPPPSPQRSPSLTPSSPARGGGGGKPNRVDAVRNEHSPRWTLRSQSNSFSFQPKQQPPQQQRHSLLLVSSKSSDSDSSFAVVGLPKHNNNNQKNNNNKKKKNANHNNRENSLAAAANKAARRKSREQQQQQQQAPPQSPRLVLSQTSSADTLDNSQRSGEGPKTRERSMAYRKAIENSRALRESVRQQRLQRMDEVEQVRQRRRNKTSSTSTSPTKRPFRFGRKRSDTIDDDKDYSNEHGYGNNMVAGVSQTRVQRLPKRTLPKTATNVTLPNQWNKSILVNPLHMESDPVDPPVPLWQDRTTMEERLPKRTKEPKDEAKTVVHPLLQAHLANKERRLGRPRNPHRVIQLIEMPEKEQEPAIPEDDNYTQRALGFLNSFRRSPTPRVSTNSEPPPTAADSTTNNTTTTTAAPPPMSAFRFSKNSSLRDHDCKPPRVPTPNLVETEEESGAESSLVSVADENPQDSPPLSRPSPPPPTTTKSSSSSPWSALQAMKERLQRERNRKLSRRKQLGDPAQTTTSSSSLSRAQSEPPQLSERAPSSRLLQKKREALERRGNYVSYRLQQQQQREVAAMQQQPRLSVSLSEDDATDFEDVNLNNGHDDDDDDDDDEGVSEYQSRYSTNGLSYEEWERMGFASVKRQDKYRNGQNM